MRVKIVTKRSVVSHYFSKNSWIKTICYSETSSTFKNRL